MKKNMNTIARILLLSTIAITIISCENGSGYPNTSNENEMEYIPVTNCYIHVENGEVIKMNPDRTAELFTRDGETSYGSWADHRSGAGYIKLKVRIPGDIMELYLMNDDYIYLEWTDAVEKDPLSTRLHYYRSKSLNN